MNYDERAKKILGKQIISCEEEENILVPIINENNSLSLIVTDAYLLGVINGKQAERARRTKKNGRVEVSKELADFMRLFYQIIEEKTDDMTIGDLYEIKNKYGLSNEEVRAIFSL